MAAYLFAAIPAVPNASAAQSPSYLEYLQGIRQQNPARAVEKHSFLDRGTGFTGGVIVDDLLGEKCETCPCHIPQTPTAAKRKDGVEYVSGSITNLTALTRAMKGITAVYHTAAAYGNPPHGRFGNYTESPPYKVNVGGMKNILKACETSESVELLVYTSSMHTTFVPGKNQYDVDGYTVPYNEGHHDFYSKSKIEAEKLCLGYDKPGKLRTIAHAPVEFMLKRELLIPKIINMFYKYGNMYLFILTKTKFLNSRLFIIQARSSCRL